MTLSTILTRQQAAAYLSVGLSNLDHIVKLGDLPRVQISKRRFGFFEADIAQYLQNRRTQ